jgi:hypothetical protein
MTSKYDPLGAYLQARGGPEVAMSFADIEKVIGGRLPPKAVNHPAWWSNNTSNNTMTQVWLDAGYRTERVDISARRLVFRRSGRPQGAATETAAPPRTPTGSTLAPGPVPTRSGGLLARVRAALAGSVKTTPGVNLAEPTGEPWEAES